MHRRFVTFVRNAEGGAGGGGADSGAAAAPAAADIPAADGLTPPGSLLGDAIPPAAADPAATPPTTTTPDTYQPFTTTDGKPLGEAAQTRVSALAKDLGLDQATAQKLADKIGAQGAPDAYADFTAPEGMTVEPVKMDEFKTLAKDLGLSQETAQKLIDFQGGRVKEMVEAPYRLWNETQTAWQNAVKADPDIGGAKLTENLAAGKRAIDAFGGDALRQALDFTGAGNNPAIVKAFIKIGQAMGEAGFITGTAPKQERSIAEKLYPSLAQNKE